MPTSKKNTEESKPASEEMVTNREIASSDGHNYFSSENERDILSLPPEIILKIFQYLPRTDLVKPVCKRWLTLSCDNSLWEKLTLRRKYIKIRHLMGMAKCDVKVLRLLNCKIALFWNWEGFGTLRFQELRELEISCTTIDGSILKKLLAPNLKVVHLRAETANMDSKIISNISDLEHLEELMISELCIEDNFELNYRSFRSLRSFKLRRCKFQNSTARGKLLHSCRKLTTFEWFGCGNITNEVFSEIQKMENLYCLILGCSRISAWFAPDPKSRLFSFCKLQLWRCRFDSKSMQMLLPCCSQLTKLDIVGGDVITHEIFWKIFEMEKLEFFHVKRCEISLRQSIAPINIAHQKSVSGLNVFLECCFFSSIDSIKNFWMSCQQVRHLEGLHVCNSYKADNQKDWIEMNLEDNWTDVMIL